MFSESSQPVLRFFSRTYSRQSLWMHAVPTIPFLFWLLEDGSWHPEAYIWLSVHANKIPPAPCIWTYFQRSFILCRYLQRIYTQYKSHLPVRPSKIKTSRKNGTMTVVADLHSLLFPENLLDPYGFQVWNAPFHLTSSAYANLSFTRPFGSFNVFHTLFSYWIKQTYSGLQ